jgi:hypothetical protein
MLPHILLDFCAEESVSVRVRRGRNAMIPEVADATVRECSHLIMDRLEQATAVAKTPQACMAVGHRERAVTIMLDVEQPVYEASTLLNAAGLLDRCVVD